VFDHPAGAPTGVRLLSVSHLFLNLVTVNWLCATVDWLLLCGWLTTWMQVHRSREVADMKQHPLPLLDY
jgi:hypothetical protein